MDKPIEDMLNVIALMNNFRFEQNGDKITFFIIKNRKIYNEYGKNPLKTKYAIDQNKDEDISSLMDDQEDTTEGLSI